MASLLNVACNKIFFFIVISHSFSVFYSILINIEIEYYFLLKCVVSHCSNTSVSHNRLKFHKNLIFCLQKILDLNFKPC